jgi:beta-glucosidase
VETSANRLTWYWDEAPGDAVHSTDFSAHIAGTFVPDVTGEWEIGVRAVGPVTVSLDGDPVVTIAEPMRGGAFFGMGSPEVRGSVHLEEGRRYELTVEYPRSPQDERVRGLAVGARAVPAGDHIARAAAIAAAAEVAIVVVGTDDDWETEGEDRGGLALPLDQDDLVAAVVAANPRTVVVVNTGSPVTMPWLDSVPAVLQLWFPGQELGDALVDVLTGDAEPGGRLPVTFPRRLEDTPAFDHYPGDGDGRAVYAEGLFIGHRWFDRHDIEPLFPFGHGLGYTTFELGMASVGGGVDHGVDVTVDVRNTGSRAGSEVVQLYVEPPAGDEARPLRTLAGFGRIDLGPGEQGTVAITLDRRAFASWLDGAWTVTPGEHVIHAGRSSRDLARAGSVTVE